MSESTRRTRWKSSFSVPLDCWNTSRLSHALQKACLKRHVSPVDSGSPFGCSDTQRARLEQRSSSCCTQSLPSHLPDDPTDFSSHTGVRLEQALSSWGWRAPGSLAKLTFHGTHAGLEAAKFSGDKYREKGGTFVDCCGCMRLLMSRLCSVAHTQQARRVSMNFIIISKSALR